jgi:hypothetical protein
MGSLGAQLDKAVFLFLFSFGGDISGVCAGRVILLIRIGKI